MLLGFDASKKYPSRAEIVFLVPLVPCARKQLKDLTTRDLGYSEKNKIYLAESLTERNRILFKDCLKVKKDMEFKFIWTLNGKIFMRKDKDSAVHHINNKEDLQKIQTR